MLAPLSLSDTECETLGAAAARVPHPRMRRRAQALLGHCRSLSIDQLAALYAVGRNATTNGQTAMPPPWLWP